MPAGVLVPRGMGGRAARRALILGAESAAGLGRECVALLWFLGVYLVVLAFVPALTRLPTGRAVAVVVGGLLVARAAIDAIRFAVGTPEAGVANFVIVWLIPVAIGVAYARRLISPRAALVVAVVAFAAQVAARRLRDLRGLPGGDRDGAHLQRVARRRCCSRCTAPGCRACSSPPRERSAGGRRGPGSGGSSRWATGER